MFSAARWRAAAEAAERRARATFNLKSIAAMLAARTRPGNES
jgi:hypothetical protein